MMDFVFKMMDFALQMTDFVFKMMDLLPRRDHEDIMNTHALDFVRHRLPAPAQSGLDGRALEPWSTTGAWTDGGMEEEEEVRLQITFKSP